MASRPLEPELNDLTELRNLINRTENIAESLEAMLPSKGAGWLDWRCKSLIRRLADAKRELHKLTEVMQVQMVEKAIEERRKVQEVLDAQAVISKR